MAVKMPYELGVAYLPIIPSTEAIAPGIQKAMNGVERTAGKQGSKFGGALATGLKRTVKTAGIGAAITAGVAVKGGISRLLGIENARASLAGLGYDAKSVDKIMGNALNSVKGTAFGMADAGKAAASAVAAGVKPGKDLERTIKLMGDTATIAGTDLGSMAGVFNKVAASNKVQMDSINQLHDAGVPALSLLADELGVTAEEASKMASAGKIDFATFQDAMETGLGGAALKSGDTTTGAFKNMLAALGRVGANLLSGVFPKFRDAFAGIIEWLGPLEEKSAKWGETLSELSSKYGPPLLSFLGDAAVAVKDAVVFMADLATAVYDNRKPISIVAGVIGALLIPALISWGVQSTIAKYKAVAAWVATQVAAVKSSAIQVAAHTRATIAWIASGARATGTAALYGVAFAFMGASAVKNAAIQVASSLRVVAANALISAGLIAQKAAMVVSAVATGVLAAAQWGLNAALTANPIGIIIALLVALGAGLVLAYKKSDTFRAIVNKAWAGIKAGAKASWDFISKVFSWFKSGIGKVAGAFTSAKDSIKRGWDKLGGIVSGPIDKAKSIINGFIKLVNKIPGVELPYIGGKATGNAPSKRTSGRTAYATGGPVFGAGTGTSDSIQALLSNGEHVLTAKEVKNMGGHGKVEALRAAARAGVMHFAKGGAVVPGRGNQHSKAQYPWASYAGDFPVGLGTPVKAWKSGTIAMVKSLMTSYGKHIRMNHTDGTSSLYAHLSSFAASVGDKITQGQTIGRTGSTGNSTGPHLHFESMGGQYKGGSGGSSIWDKITGSIGGLTSWFSDKIKSGLTGKVKDGGFFGKSGMMGMLGGIGGNIRDYVKGKLFDSGGLARGTGVMAKNVIAPERTLSPRQTVAFERAMSNDFGTRGSDLPVDLSAHSIDALAAAILAGAREVSVGTVRDVARSAANTRQTTGVLR